MTKERSELKSIGYEIFIGVLSILSIVNLMLLYVVQDRMLDNIYAAADVSAFAFCEQQAC